MRSHEGVRAERGKLGRAGARAALTAVAVLMLSGCSSTVKHGWLPAERGTTNQTNRIMDFWISSWIAALAVGVLVWGLAIWCMVAYRRRRDETGLPPQVSYHLPLEIMYTVVPLMMVAVLFYFTARDEAAIADTSKTPDIRINVVGKQWSWDFNYLEQHGAPLGVYDSGLMGELNGKPGVETELPDLYLPVGQRVEFTLTSRDVIHSFWVPAFLYKLDTIPGLTNRFQVVPEREGTFKGKCAELCGEYHSQMLFNVRVVSQAEFDRHIAELRAKGQIGDLSSQLGRSRTSPDRLAAEKTSGSNG